VAGNDDTKSDAGSNPSTEAIFAEINQQTGVIDWQELVKHFARGVVIRVDADLDLVKVAHSMSLDDKAQMQQWLDAGSIRRASDDDARGWTQIPNALPLKSEKSHTATSNLPAITLLKHVLAKTESSKRFIFSSGYHYNSRSFPQILFNGRKKTL